MAQVSLPKKISVQTAAKLMGVSPRYIHLGLQTNRLPFGSAVQGKGGRWSYHIAPAHFIKYMEGEQEQEDE